MFSAKCPPCRLRSLGVVMALLLGAAAGCGSTDDRPATWTFISGAITVPGCATANCHSALADRASVDLSGRDVGFFSLVNRGFVTSGDAARSEVLTLMRAEGNLRMPPDEPLPEVDIQLVEKWISQGTLGDPSTLDN